jgi:pimeloyl-ACP methyl ester carboxylesterase
VAAPAEQTGTGAMASRVKRSFAQCPDGNIEYVEVGDGEPLVLLHATPASCLAYRDVAPLLADRFRCIAMSTMGYGQSDRPSRPYTSLSQFARAVTWLMDDLGIESAHLYGNSTGSNIAAVVAAEHPARVNRLVLAEIFNWGTPRRRELHEGLHHYVPERPDGGHLLELWRQAGGPEREDTRAATLELIHRIIVNSTEGAEVYGEMGWEGAGPYAMTRTDIWAVVARITAHARHPRQHK